MHLDYPAKLGMLFHNYVLKYQQLCYCTIWLCAFSHQYVLALGKAHGDLSALTADVHEFRVEVRHSLGQEQDGVFVLLFPHPDEENRNDCNLNTTCNQD